MQATQEIHELMIYGPAASFAVFLTFSMAVGCHCHPPLSERWLRRWRRNTGKSSHNQRLSLRG